MAESTIWWLMAGSAVAVELVTGTFYLLMLAIGLASAALAAHLGASITFQFLSAAVVGGAAIVGWHLLRGRRPQGPGSAANPDLHLDVGGSLASRRHRQRALPRRQLDRFSPPRRDARPWRAPRGRSGGQPPDGGQGLIGPRPPHRLL